ncbi:hypothetical protein QAD02_005645 [Eretmocerus hayati]|uniref:Uncharacterized protein n=1 Tax=Eretmocerus hayati TaxID=131215 RepID=A0ACC2NU27_9HYME|nr:hypothetical protein QAD02_005645 [Eretmocerus hayati]
MFERGSGTRIPKDAYIVSSATNYKRKKAIRNATTKVGSCVHRVLDRGLELDDGEKYQTLIDRLFEIQRTVEKISGRKPGDAEAISKYKEKIITWASRLVEFRSALLDCIDGYDNRTEIFEMGRESEEEPKHEVGARKSQARTKRLEEDVTP